MEAFTQKWAVISLLEDASEGAEFYYTDFPLHVTLAGVFATNKRGQQLADELAVLLSRQHPIEIEADKKDMFGPSKDIAVMRIKKNPALMRLYQAIYTWLEASGARYNSPEYQGGGYVPHSTYQKTGALARDEKRTLHSVSLIDLYPQSDGYRRSILKTVELL